MTSYFSSDKSLEQYIGQILKELNSGKTLKSLLLEMRWKERAKLLLNIDKIRECYISFQREMQAKNVHTEY